jgi:cell division protein FtsQ
MPRKPKPTPRSAPPLAQNRRAPKVVPKRTWQDRSIALHAWWARRLQGLRQLFSVLLRVAMAAAVVAALVAMFRIVERYVHGSRGFAITHIDVRGQQHLSKEAVIAGAGLALGQNVFEVEPEQARLNLLQLPWVESASVRRMLPGSYAIEIRERHAIALLGLEELHLVSEDGLAFKPLSPGDPYDFPIITGLDSTQVAQDKRASASALMSAVALLHDYQDAGLWKREVISEIHIEPDGALSLYIGADATHVRLGKAPFRQKLERLSEVMGLLGSQQTRAAYVLLDNQRRLDRVTVRLR